MSLRESLFCSDGVKVECDEAEPPDASMTPRLWDLKWFGGNTTEASSKSPDICLRWRLTPKLPSDGRLQTATEPHNGNKGKRKRPHLRT